MMETPRTKIPMPNRFDLETRNRWARGEPPSLLKFLRVVRERTQLDIANRIGVTSSYVSMVERGEGVLTDERWTTLAPFLALGEMDAHQERTLVWLLADVELDNISLLTSENGEAGGFRDGRIARDAWRFLGFLGYTSIMALPWQHAAATATVPLRVLRTPDETTSFLRGAIKQLLDASDG